MDINNFLPGETVLFIGEGNFSFSASFQEILPNVEITATCYEPTVDPHRECQKFQNIEKLKQKGVRVLLGVDGTKLCSHAILGKEQFSKIIFNFPHVGGKMKISLNRKLLRDFFGNISRLLIPQGLILMSLCQGQGGTAADSTFRDWGNSWQVVEMAAHGDFVLCNINSFPSALFPDYTSVGYRSRDQPFHTSNALVHVFRKAKPFFSTTNVKFLLQCMDYKCLETFYGDVICESTYVDRYKTSPMKRDGSPINYFCQALKNMPDAEFGDSESVKYLTDIEIPLYVKNLSGKYTCKHKGKINPCNLRASLLDVVDYIIPFVGQKKIENTVVFAGTVFNALDHDFSSMPLSSHLLIIGGNSIESVCLRYINQLLSRTGNGNRTCLGTHSTSSNSNSPQATLLKNLSLSASEATKLENIIGQIYLIKTPDTTVELSACLIFLDELALQLFQANDWREIWTANVANGILVPTSIYPQIFNLDVCFSNASCTPYDEASFVQALWAIGGDFIVKLSSSFNEFTSEEGWKSRCYSISYRSFESALYKDRARDIHKNIMHAICTKLGYRLH